MLRARGRTDLTRLELAGKAVLRAVRSVFPVIPCRDRSWHGMNWQSYE